MLAHAWTDPPPVDARFCALVVLADPASMQFTRWVISTLASIAFRVRSTASQGEWLFLRARAKAGKIDAANSQGLTNVLRRCLKRLVTLAYCWGMISAASTQRLVDRFELWSA